MPLPRRKSLPKDERLPSGKPDPAFVYGPKKIRHVRNESTPDQHELLEWAAEHGVPFYGEDS